MADFNEDLCMRNSYELLLGKKTMDQLVDKNDKLYLIFSPEYKIVSMEDDVYDSLIDYFIYTEEYEKCEEILNLKNSLA
tara:strand:- start:155 stop:391 length:237 start_codon:yes stop_codon:yes gene_type:complete